jgi:hypothetical protein
LEARILELAGEKPKPIETTVTEAEFQAAVEREAKRLGWKVFHCRDSRKSEAGFPDLVLVRGNVIFAELKTETGIATAAQSSWQAALMDAGAECHLWRPSMWQAILERLA